MVGEGELRHKFTPQFDKIYSCDERGSFRGGIMTDGESFYSYGERPADAQQRTKARTEKYLQANKKLVQVQLNQPASFWMNATMHHSGKERKVVRPYDPQVNFTGIVSLEDLCKATDRDTELLKGRVVLLLDAGEKRTVAGHIVVDGVRHKFPFLGPRLPQEDGTGRCGGERQAGAGGAAQDVSQWRLLHTGL